MPDSPLTPPLPDTGSSSRLVLLPNTDDRDPFEDYTTGDEDDEDEDPQHGVHPPPIPPLTTSIVFLYLLSPYLRLGAIYAPDVGSTSLTYGLTGLIVAAFLSAFCRQIWFLLGRYLRRSSTEDILVHIFARRQRRLSSHGGRARYVFTTFSGLFRILLAAMYLRDSVDSMLLLELPDFGPPRTRLNVSITLSILVFVLSLPRSLASKSIVYTTVLSVASYLGWLVAVSRAYGANEPWPPNPSAFQRGVLWNEISSLTFACTTTMTVPLSTSMTAGTTSVSPASRSVKARSFQLLNLFSTTLAALLMFPIVVIAASSHAPKASTSISDNLVLALRIATLVLSVPCVVVSITSLPLHGVAYRLINTDLALAIIVLAILVLTLVPLSIASVLDDVILFLAVSGAFLLPALAHIAIHYFRRPLTIVVPQARSSAPSSPRPSASDRSPSPSRDPLLQRKERLLQRRRFGKRLLWDILIWIVLVPICVCALVWAAGRVARRW